MADTVFGKFVSLPDNRAVFVGSSCEDVNAKFIGFRNGETELKFKISLLAYAALCAILRGDFDSRADVNFPHVPKANSWVAVERKE